MSYSQRTLSRSIELPIDTIPPSCFHGTEFLEDAVLGRHGRRRANLGIVPQVPHRSYSYVRLVRVKLHSPMRSGHPSYSLILPFWLRALRRQSRSDSAGRPAPVLFFIAASFF